jgi:hypothetical protein
MNLDYPESSSQSAIDEDCIAKVFTDVHQLFPDLLQSFLIPIAEELNN